VFDEATSSLDPAVEALIQSALENLLLLTWKVAVFMAYLHGLLPGRTCLMVSHKVSSVQGADRIVLLRAGRILEQGPMLSS
jgi:ABC-type multidrug transport system fused ATPase/permease subunit